MEDGTVSLFVEADRRIGDTWKIEIEARFLVNIDRRNTLAPFERDGFVNLRLLRYF